MKIHWSKTRYWLQGPSWATSTVPQSANPLGSCIPKGTQHESPFPLGPSSFPCSHTCCGSSTAQAEAPCRLLPISHPELSFGAITPFTDWVVPHHQGQQNPHLPVIHSKADPNTLSWLPLAAQRKGKKVQNQLDRLERRSRCSSGPALLPTLPLLKPVCGRVWHLQERARPCYGSGKTTRGKRERKTEQERGLSTYISYLFPLSFERLWLPQ